MLSCSVVSNSAYDAYITVNNLLIGGIPTLAFITIAMYQWCLHGHEYGDLFYYLIKTLFSIERKEDKEKQGQEEMSTAEATPQYEKSLTFYSQVIKSNRRRNIMLLFITIFTLSSSLAVFFEGVFLANVFIATNSNCPYDYDTLDCFAYQAKFDPNPNCYFQCTPGAQTPNTSAFYGQATCYRWVIQDITTFDFFGQIGICTGILGAFGFFFQAFLALSIRIFTPAEDKSRKGFPCGYRNRRIGTIGPFQRPLLAYCFIIFYVLIFVVGIFGTLITLPFLKQGVSTFTYVVAFTIFVLSLPAIMIASVDISAASHDDVHDNVQNEDTNKDSALASITPSTSAQSEVVKVEPRSFTNLPIKIKTMNNVVVAVSSTTD